MAHVNTTLPVPVRILSRVCVDEHGCWLFEGYRTKRGYGQIVVRRRCRPAHRVLYESIVGPLPRGLHLDHLCRVRHCVNPQHLEPVTPGENVLRGDGPGAQNAQKTRCKRGHLLNATNTRVYRGKRCCRRCATLHVRARRAGSRLPS